MFESASLKHKVDKATFRREEPKLREALLNAQYDLKQKAGFPVLILVAGVEGAGKGEMVNLLNEWMDPRYISTHAFFEPRGEEAERPPQWRFWKALPAKGRIGIFFGAWHSVPILQRVWGQIGEGEFTPQLAEIVRLEKMLVDEGVLLLKYWLHLSRGQMRKRLEELEKDPATRWRVTEHEWAYYKRYRKFVKICEPFLRRTSSGEAPWIIVPGMDPEYRALTMGRHLLSAIRERLDDKPVPRLPDRTPPLAPSIGKLNVIRALELAQPLEKSDYAKQLAKWQGRLNLLSRDPRLEQVSIIAVFEGNDAAGKGGAIRRVTGALDARHYHVIPIAAPTEEEKAQPYLWRFWRHIPRKGHFTIFDRSWYGRVLVERVERFCSEADWRRAYSEINDFEEQLARHGMVVMKFWLQISKDEQLRRFEERKQVPYKQHKITDEDWRNREKWDAYHDAVCDMVDRTSTDVAPWTLVEANDKYYARLKVLRTMCERIEAAL